MPRRGLLMRNCNSMFNLDKRLTIQKNATMVYIVFFIIKVSRYEIMESRSSGHKMIRGSLAQ